MSPRAPADARRAGVRRTGTAFPTPQVEAANATRLLAVDPGSVHNGLAWFDCDVDGWACVGTRKQSPVECVRDVQAFLQDPTPAILVIEEFRLYPWAMQKQGFSSLGVVETIGALRWLHYEIGRDHVRLEMQGAFIKDRGAAFMARAGVEHIGPNVHTRDAEAHGWFKVGQLTGGQVVGYDAGP